MACLGIRQASGKMALREPVQGDLWISLGKKMQKRRREVGRGKALCPLLLAQLRAGPGCPGGSRWGQDRKGVSENPNVRSHFKGKGIKKERRREQGQR
ncbi:hypothetical protein H1C71_032972 [Ictidomys tridecemlineatus]|nr:hypothetical protein H1C71_032972 [Ictidomys tridecemlineatus]